MTLDGQHGTRFPTEASGSNGHGMENLRRFMCILQEWDRAEKAATRTQRGSEFVDRCFTDEPKSGKT